MLLWLLNAASALAALAEEATAVAALVDDQQNDRTEGGYPSAGIPSPTGDGGRIPHCFKWCMDSPCDTLEGNCLFYECGACPETAACRPDAVGFRTIRGEQEGMVSQEDVRDERVRAAVDGNGVTVAMDDVDGNGVTVAMDDVDGNGVTVAMDDDIGHVDLTISLDLLRIVPPAPSGDAVGGTCLELTLDANASFTHGCDAHVLRRVECEPSTQTLVALLTLAPSHPAHAIRFGCMLRAMSAMGVILAGVAEVAAVAAHLVHDNFAVRLAASNMLVALTPRDCPACATTIASQIDEHQISTRWIAVDALERLGYSRMSVAASAAAAAVVAAGDGVATPRAGAPALVSAFLERLDPHHAPPSSPGTRWMAVKCVALFGDAHDPALITPLVHQLDDDDMGFPGVGLAALEALVDVYGGGGVPRLREVTEAILPLLAARSDSAMAEVRSALAVELLHRLGLRATCDVEPAVGVLRTLEGHQSVHVRAAVARAIGGIASDPSTSLATLALDAARPVRCAAVVARAMGEQRTIGWSAWALPSECAEPDWDSVHSAYLRKPSGVEDDEYAQFVDAPLRVLPLVSAAPVSEEGAHACMSLLHGPRGGEETTLVEWGAVHHVRWLAFFALRFVAARWPTLVKVRAMQMLTDSNDYMVRFAAVKALGIVAMVCDRGATAAFVGVLGDEVDVIRWAGGEALLAITPRNSPWWRAGDDDMECLGCPIGSPTPWSVSDRAGFRMTLRLVTGPIESGNDNAVFASSAVIRRLAAGCNATVRAVVEAALRTAATVPPTTPPRVRAAWQLRQSVPGCEYEPADALQTADPVETYEPRRLTPSRQTANPMQRTGAWRCLKTLRGLPRMVVERAQRTMRREIDRGEGAFCNLEDAGSAGEAALARKHGLLIRRQVLNHTALAEVRKSFRALLADGPSWDKHNQAGRTFMGALSDPNAMARQIPETVHVLNNALRDWCERGVLPPSRCPQLSATEFVHLNRTLSELMCSATEEKCGCDWHMDGDFSPDGVRATKLWLMVGKTGEDVRKHSNLVLAPLDALNELCSRALAINASVGVLYPQPPPITDPDMRQMIEQRIDSDALEAVSCTVVADPGDLVLFTNTVYHRTQDMLAQTRVALVVEAVHSTWSGGDRLHRLVSHREGGAGGDEFMGDRREPDDFYGEPS